MAYDEKKDARIHEVAFEKLNERQSVDVSVYSYDGGELKLGVNRKVHTSGGTRTDAIRRMTRDEARIVGELLLKAASDDSYWTR